jgi:hypothetical protein
MEHLVDNLQILRLHFLFSEILENYPRSPYLAADNDNFPDSQEREHPGYFILVYFKAL